MSTETLKVLLLSLDYDLIQLSTKGIFLLDSLQRSGRDKTVYNMSNLNYLIGI